MPGGLLTFRIPLAIADALMAMQPRFGWLLPAVLRKQLA